ncbi:MAG TPA: hypothetical protein VFW19_09010 [Allosphingosinicella sp.]|nr:hypothetical protein [Allosphingosinicella sp.]
MLSLFGPRLPIDRDELDWQLATFKWMELEFGPVAPRRLVLPTPHFFPASSRKGHGRIEDLFGHVRGLAGMADWPCTLKAGRSDRPTKAGLALLLRHEGPSAPSGTFRGPIRGEDAIITYNPSLAGDTDSLVATFAHELAHYLMRAARTAPPGGWALHELHTDLVAVGLGFGIFLANSARNFSQFQSAGEIGWSSRTQGYLSEGALVTGLVIFQRLGGRAPDEARPYLKSYLRTDLRNASRALQKMLPDMTAAVAAIDLAEFASE